MPNYPSIHPKAVAFFRCSLPRPGLREFLVARVKYLRGREESQRHKPAAMLN